MVSEKVKMGLNWLFDGLRRSKKQHKSVGFCKIAYIQSFLFRSNDFSPVFMGWATFFSMSFWNLRWMRENMNIHFSKGEKTLNEKIWVNNNNREQIFAIQSILDYVYMYSQIRSTPKLIHMKYANIALFFALPLTKSNSHEN